MKYKILIAALFATLSFLLVQAQPIATLITPGTSFVRGPRYDQSPNMSLAQAAQLRKKNLTAVE